MKGIPMWGALFFGIRAYKRHIADAIVVMKGLSGAKGEGARFACSFGRCCGLRALTGAVTI